MAEFKYHVQYYMAVIVCPIALLLHFSGLLLLWKVRDSMDRTQSLLLANLSATEIINCLYFLVFIILESYGIATELDKQVDGVLWNLVRLPMYSFMIFLTFERLLRLVTNFRYPIYWSVGKTKRTCALIWIFVLAACVLLGMFAYQSKVVVAVDLSLNIVFIVLAFTTYGYALFVISCRGANQVTINNSRRHPSLLKGMAVGIAIITTFFVFIVVPDLIDAYSVYAKRDFSNTYEDVIYMMDLLSYTCDPLIYILLSPQIRRYLRQMGRKQPLPSSSHSVETVL